MKGKSMDRLTQLFLVEKPYLLEYHYRSKYSGYKEDRETLKLMIRAGLVEHVKKDMRTITFRFIGPLPA
jgi:hypothetical protein